jgi:hypothetical protein
MHEIEFRHLDLLAQTERLPVAALVAYQGRLAETLIRHASEKFPFYAARLHAVARGRTFPSGAMGTWSSRYSMNPARQSSSDGRVVLTGFYDLATPLIRHAIGDFAETAPGPCRADAPCPACTPRM